MGLVAMTRVNVVALRALREPMNKPGHRFEAFVLFYLSGVALVRECQSRGIHDPRAVLDHVTGGFVDAIAPRFNYGVFNFLLGLLARSYEGGWLAGYLLIIRGIRLISIEAGVTESWAREDEIQRLTRAFVLRTFDEFVMSPYVTR